MEDSRQNNRRIVLLNVQIDVIMCKKYRSMKTNRLHAREREREKKKKKNPKIQLAVINQQ